MVQELFTYAADKYKNMVFRVALNYLGNKFDAEDTVQEVMLKLYTSDKHFESEDHLKNWLIRVTVNICKNILRTPWRRKNVGLEALNGAVVFQQEEDGSLFKTVMAMQEKYRVILYLFYFEELSVKEISAILNLRETAVTTRLYRARTQLKRSLMEARP